MLNPEQIAAAQAIVNIFETGTVHGDYSRVTVTPGDAGHLSYGRAQASLTSGHLHALVKRYTDEPAARLRHRLDSYLWRLQARDQTLDNNTRLHNLLRACADDPLMRRVQDDYFNLHFWEPALTVAEDQGLHTALGLTVVYDSLVHGSWERMRQRITDKLGTPDSAGEQTWLYAYVLERMNWLAGQASEPLRLSVYRMQVLRALMDAGQWNLEQPLVVRGQEISPLTLAATPAHCYEGPQPGARSLHLDTPLQRGLDVRLFQLALSESDRPVTADGIYGRDTQACWRQYLHSQAASEVSAGQVKDLVATL